MKLVYWFFERENGFVPGTCCVLIFLRETFCMLIFLLWKFNIDLSLRETDFVHGTCCVLIFVCGTYCLFFLFVKLEHWFSLRNMLRTDFFVEPVACWFFILKLVICWFFSLRNLHIDFTNLKLVLFIEHVASWLFHETCCMLIFLFVKLVYWFFSWRNWFRLWKFLPAN